MIISMAIHLKLVDGGDWQWLRRRGRWAKEEEEKKEEAIFEIW